MTDETHSRRSGDPELLKLFKMIEGVTSIGERLSRLSAELVGRPYLSHPLIGSPEEPEQLVGRVDGFDCVTLVETIMALALCRSPEGFEPALRALRYQGGEVSFLSRNHYMTLWIERNEKKGRITRVLPHLWSEEPRPRRLAALEGYPPFKRRLSYVPLDRLPELHAAVMTGDLVCFVSQRPDLDTFHAGLLKQDRSLGLCHASRSRGRVVEETLSDFLERNETAGLMVARLRPGAEEETV